MRRKLITLLLLMAFLGGCVSTNQKNDLLFAQNTFLRTVNSLTILRDAGKFDEEEVAKIKVLIKTGEAILDEWTESVLAGKDPPSTISVFETILLELIRYGKEDENG